MSSNFFANFFARDFASHDPKRKTENLEIKMGLSGNAMYGILCSKGHGMNSFAGKSVHADDRPLHVELTDGRIISTPMAWYPELQGATLASLAEYTFICDGTGIEWENLDYHLSIEAMLQCDAVSVAGR